MNNDDKLREQMKSEPVPERLKPENIKIMLDNEAPKKKRSGISMAGRVAAAAAACTVIGGTAAYTMNNRNFDKSTTSYKEPLYENTAADTVPAAEPTATKQTNYMSGAKDYEQVYTMFKAAAGKYKEEIKKEKRNLVKTEETVSGIEEYDMGDAAAESFDESYLGSGKGGGLDTYTNEPEVPIIDGQLPTEPDTEPVTEPTTEASTEDSTESTTEPTTETPSTEKDPEHSETYYQEQDVLEADIVKTDGKRIYYVCMTKNDKPVLQTADVKDGKFTGNSTVYISDAVLEDDEDSYVNVSDMYVYNDMIVILGRYSKYTDYYTDYTFVAFYTTGDDPELIDVYKQTGYYNDVRISPEGYMLLTSTYSSCGFDELDGSDDIERYIPCFGLTKEYGAVAAEDILLPNEFDTSNWLSYTVVGSIDLSKTGAPAVRDIKTMAGYSGSIYCSADNLYIASYNWNVTTANTNITRISVKGGNIEPQAGCTINGHVNDQFSMSEYNGYLRVAASYTEYKEIFHEYSGDEGFIDGLWNRIKGEENGYYTYETVTKDNRVYVLDMDLNMVGSIDGLGIDEEVKSASFSGNMAYIVTFRQTDPLYAVDLSDPTNPVVLDELKLNGFSTYMQSWNENLLLGFGENADDNGRVTGIKLTLFDNSDPNDLKVADSYTWDMSQYDDDFWSDPSGQTYEYISSVAVWERKALLIAPEKNLIGVPLSRDKTQYGEDYYDCENSITYQYVFFSVEDGKLVEKGIIDNTVDLNEGYYNRSFFNRAIYIGDYVYALSARKIVAASIDTLEISDELEF
ncbi:beta-propeller domain-containing protein [Ruminococcus flavefaciens]|uniref:beta-propeller domain-containing protein n=1 Tax=Ruminococcus flavefaciens TaxID=1265 RepID=UPI000465B14E|nr:beta-propeller domain-containing protein [Ruminococcus flavefaciens]